MCNNNSQSFTLKSSQWSLYQCSSQVHVFILSKEPTMNWSVCSVQTNCERLTKHEAKGKVFGEFFSYEVWTLTKLNNEWFVPVLTQQEEKPVLLPNWAALWRQLSNWFQRDLWRTDVGEFRVVFKLWTQNLGPG